VIVGGVSLKAAPAARQDDAETVSIIVNGRKGLYEHGHRGDPAVPVSNATSTWCLGFVLGGKVHVRPAFHPRSGQGMSNSKAAVAVIPGTGVRCSYGTTCPSPLVFRAAAAL
jgi:hypothetical protein